MPYEIPPWMVNPPNYGETFVKGAQAGAQIGQSFVARRVAADQNARENALQPLREQMLNNQISESALNIQKGMDAQRDAIANKYATIRLSEAARQISKDNRWADPTARAEVWQMGIDTPSLVGTKEWTDTMKMFDTATELKVKMAAEETKAKLEADRAKHWDDMYFAKIYGFDTQADIAGRKNISNENIADTKAVATTTAAGTKADAIRDAARIRAAGGGAEYSVLAGAAKAAFTKQIAEVYKDSDLTDEQKQQKVSALTAGLHEQLDALKLGTASTTPATPDQQAFKAAIADLDNQIAALKLKKVQGGRGKYFGLGQSVDDQIKDLTNQRMQLAQALNGLQEQPAAAAAPGAGAVVDTPAPATNAPTRKTFSYDPATGKATLKLQ